MDICITIPKTIPWEEYQKELDTVKDGKMEMNYRVSFRPDVKPYEKCYLCHDGKIKGWMYVTRVAHRKGFTCTVTGKQWPESWYVARSGPFHELENKPALNGFRGVRYVNSEFRSKYNLYE